MNTPVSRLLRNQTQVVSVHPLVTVSEAVHVMVKNNVGSLVVLDADENLVGIFTERDLLQRVVAKGLDPESASIESVMTRGVRVVDRTADRHDLLLLMEELHIRHVPIVDNDVVLGVVSLRDVLRSENAEKEHEINQLKGYVSNKPYPTYPG